MWQVCCFLILTQYKKRLFFYISFILFIPRVSFVKDLSTLFDYFMSDFCFIELDSNSTYGVFYAKDSCLAKGVKPEQKMICSKMLLSWNTAIFFRETLTLLFTTYIKGFPSKTNARVASVTATRKGGKEKGLLKTMFLLVVIVSLSFGIASCQDGVSSKKSFSV